MLVLMYIKTYETDISKLVAVCDNELIGKTAIEAGMRFEISEEFYKGELVDASQVKFALQMANTANIVGKRSIEAAISCQAIDQDSVIMIEGIPYALMVRM